MTPNAAQTLVLSFFDGERKFVQTKSPHANQPTPPRPKRGPRPQEWIHNHKTGENLPRLRRLFKGHRA
jgi:hypothetical protein